MISFLARTASGDGVTLLPKSLGPIAFYALFILSGALLAFFLTKVRAKRLGYNPSDVDNIFLLAFPMGLVGARVWYYVAQFSEFYVANNPIETFVRLFGFYNGSFQGLSGLSIQGGVTFGIISGMLFVHKYRRNMRLLDIADCAVPTILLAQAVGRLGNFFNGEVYGFCVDSSGWSWLGQWFVNQMSYDGSTGAWICVDSVGNAIEGQMALPLWLIEALINVAGYFIITRVLQYFTQKKGIRGAVTFSYLIWYGIVRAILEPLRNPKFIMSVNGEIPTSIVYAIVFIVLGVILEFLVFFNHFYLKPRNKQIGLILINYASWFDSLSRTTRIILEAIPVTAWINSILYRMSKDNFTWGVLNIFFGPIFWIIDLVTTVWKDKIVLFADGKGLAAREAELEQIGIELGEVKAEPKVEETKDNEDEIKK